MDRKILALSLFVLFFITAQALHAQSFDELLGGFSTSRESDEKADYVTVEASYHSPFLVLSATVKQGWHIYAFTQKEGATLPAQIAFDNLDVTVDGPIRPTSIPKREHLPYYDVPLESFEGTVTWLIVVFAMALSLMDIWTLSAPSFLGQGKSAELMQQEGALGAFFKGIITTLLAIPCGAPLLSPALGWADAQIRSGQTGQVFLLYGTIGLGMSLPYLLLGAFPELLRFLPKPGEWMDTFKKTMGFCLLIAVVWILYFIEMSQVVPMVAVLFAIWFACWFIGKEQNLATKDKRTFKAWIVSAAVVVSAIFISFDIPRVAFPYTLERAMQRRLDDWSGVRTQGHWIPYSDGRLFENLVEQKRLVLVDFTADWCVNCKVLESTVLESQEVLSELDRRGIVSLQANISRSDEAKKLLNQLGPESVPAMAIFSVDRPLEPVVIRGNYGAKTLIKQIP